MQCACDLQADIMDDVSCFLYAGRKGETLAHPFDCVRCFNQLIIASRIASNIGCHFGIARCNYRCDCCLCCYEPLMHLQIDGVAGIVLSKTHSHEILCTIILTLERTEYYTSLLVLCRRHHRLVDSGRYKKGI